MQTLPLYEDGRLLFTGISSLVDKWFALFSSDWCDGSGRIKDKDINFFMKRLETWTLFDRNSRSDYDWLGLKADTDSLSCSGFKKWLKAMLFAVSGYHRHVGTVADIASDPDFASFSNAVGEAFGRPRQHLQMALIAGSTARVFPKLVADYSFLAAGLAQEERASKILQELQSDMQAIAQQVSARNVERSKRGSMPYLQMHPEFVESSVAV